MLGRASRRMLTLGLFLLAFLLTWCTASATTSDGELPTAEELLTRSIAYHDPNGVFLTRSHHLTFAETRADGSERPALLEVDVGGERFAIERGGEHVWRAELDDTSCTVTFDGRPADAFSTEERQEHRLDCDRATMMRNYYVYLWGMPMKLRDPGTHLGAVEAQIFEDRPVHALRVTYDEAVGTDIWTFYFDRSTAALVGYRFDRADPSRDGETIIFDGEVEGAGLRLPASRAWFMNADRRYLGTDTLVAIEAP
ncbi:MAG: DUF6503 family protein [Acidobacteriota bacterium]